VINFAQGELLMVGAFLALTFVTILGLNFWLGALLAIAGTAVFGYFLDRVVVRPIVGQPIFAIVMVTIGIGFVSRSSVSMIPGWGVDTHTIETPFSNRTVSLDELVLSQDHLAIMVTKLGVAMQATSQNQLAAYYMGIPVKTVFSLIWGISAAVAAFAGILLAPQAFVHSNMGFIGIKAFPAAVLGGFGSIPGAVVGGLIIGIVESLAGFYADGIVHSLTGYEGETGAKDMAAYVVLLLVLIVRPEGLFGETTRKKV
jgi:branched-chain amino acid transport system permease protein